MFRALRGPMEDETSSSEPLLGALEAQNGIHTGNGLYTDEVDILVVISSNLINQSKTHLTCAQVPCREAT